MLWTGEGVLKPAFWPFTDAAYEVFEPELLWPIEAELMESPRGDDELDDSLACDWI
jgi:hypothetical protein